MSYEFFFSESGKFLLVWVMKDVTPALALELAQKATQHGARHQIEKYLFDVRGAINRLSLKDNTQLANEDLARLGYQKSAQTAVLVKAGDTSHNFVCFACQRAGYNVKLFTREEEAVAWLDAP